MKRLAFAALLLAAVPASAHYAPGERTVIVQAEERSLSLLVMYRPPSGIIGEVLNLDSLYGRPGERREFTRALYAVRALSPVTVTLDGGVLHKRDLQIKLVEDPPGSGRAMVAVLVSATIPAGRHTLSVQVDQTVEPTQTEWLDRSGGQVVDFGPRPAGTWLQDKAALELVWGP